MAREKKKKDMIDDETHKLVKLGVTLDVLKSVDEPFSESEVYDRLDTSKSTTHRRMKELDEKGMIIEKRGEGEYVLTEVGRAVADRTDEYTSEISRMREYEDFLSTINSTELELDYISDGEVTRASPENPVAPLVRLAEVTTEASEAKILTSSIAPQAFEVGQEKVRQGEQKVEIVLDRRTIDSIRNSRWFSEELEMDTETGNLRVWIHEGPVPHQVGILDEKLCLGAEDEDRMPVAVLETENEEAVEWARHTFEEYKKRSEPLSHSEL